MSFSTYNFVSPFPFLANVISAFSKDEDASESESSWYFICHFFRFRLESNRAKNYKRLPLCAGLNRIFSKLLLPLHSERNAVQLIVFLLAENEIKISLLL